MARRMRAHDWSQTSLGAPAHWPESLRTAVSICLTSRFPIVVWWGRNLTQLYNDGYISALGPGKHPHWLGRSGRECWSEIWETIGPMLDGVVHSGQATWSEELLLVLDRHLPREETYFTFSYSPILAGDAHSVGGVFCAVTETTEYVVGRRRLETLRALGSRLGKASTPEAVAERAAEVLGENLYDVPFAALYLQDASERPLRLAADVRGGGGFAGWPIERVRTLRRAEDVALPKTAGLSGGSWPESPLTGLAVPVTAPGLDSVAGVLVVGVSPRLLLDPPYRLFVDGVAAQLGAALAGAAAYQAERQRAESLAELDRAKTTFFSNVSHEFRTPLTLMLGPLDDALRADDEPLGPRTRDRIEVAHRSSIRLLKLVNTLLDFSRIEAGRIEASYEETDLCALTAELASMFRSAFERAGLALAVSAEALLEPVFVDREMWEKIVFNLLSNAFKFTLRGGVSVRMTPAADGVQLVVEDTGIGIPESELPRVFERFHRVRGAQGRTHEGTGIGLSLVEELVKLHGGTVALTSEVGRGTRVSVTLPTGSAHLPAERIRGARTAPSTALGAGPYVEEALGWLPDEVATPSARPPGEPTGAVSTPGARILLADDNADVRQYLQRLLARHWNVEAVSDGEEALAALRSDPPDLVLTDVMMPKRDGFGLLRAIREDPLTRTLPVVLVSARAGEEARVEGIAAGADDYLTKPFSARELVARVNGHLELARTRREAQARLEESEARFRTMADTAPAMLWVSEPDGSRSFISRGWKEFTGQTGAAALGLGWLDAVHPEDREGARALYLGANARQEPFALDCRVRRADGAWRWIIESARPRFGPTGEYGGFIGSVIDITDRKVAEEAWRESERRVRSEAERANEAKDNFLAVLSHELRSPMNAMLGWLRVLKTAGQRDADLVGRAVDTLERNIWIQAQIINDLLDVSRIMSGKLELDFARVDLTTAVTACVESLRPSCEGKRVTLGLELDDANLEVIGDNARLQQVVANLLGNAIKFTDAGGFITVRVRRRNGSAAIVVEDTGQGIAPEFLPHMFARFSQGNDSRARKHGGLGLGLAIVKNLVALHGGTVRAESEGVGRGARFVVDLPLAEGRPPIALPKLALPEQAKGESLPGLDVLVIDDDGDSRLALALALEENGARVRHVASVRGALEAWDERRPDVVISDIGIPGEDGYALIRAIREREDGRGQPTLAIAMTGFAARQDREMALRAGFDEHVAKPVDLEILLERVSVLEAARSATKDVH